MDFWEICDTIGEQVANDRIRNGLAVIATVAAAVLMTVFRFTRKSRPERCTIHADLPAGQTMTISTEKESPTKVKTFGSVQHALGNGEMTLRHTYPDKQQ